MSDIRFNRWLHQSGTGGVYQDSAGNVGIGTSVPTTLLDIQGGNIKIGSNTLSSSGVSTFSNIVATSGSLTGITTIGVTTVTATSLNVNGNDYPSAGPLSNRNLIINGDMKVYQRGISTTGLTGNYNNYTTLDRYRFENYNDGGTNTSVWSMEQSTDAPTGFSNSLKLTATTADADYGSGSSQTNVHTRLEAQNLQHLKYGNASAENLTLSFWVKSSVTGTYLIWFYQDDDGRHCTKTYTINAANTWEYKTVTISGDTTGVIDNDNGLGLHVRWILATGSTFTSGTYLDGSWANFTNADTYAGHAVNVASSTNNTFYLTGVQLEVGTVATPFEHRSYGDELARCQRYYQGMDTRTESAAYHCFGTSHFTSASTAFAIMPFATEMRIRPTSIDTSAANTFFLIGITNFTTITIDQVSRTSGIILFSGGSGGWTNYRSERWLSNNNNTAYCFFNAEL